MGASYEAPHTISANIIIIFIDYNQITKKESDTDFKTTRLKGRTL
jgi:hypothetical protein